MKRRALLSFWPELLALVIVAPLSYLWLDNVPPQQRIAGYITSHEDPSRQPRLGEDFDIHWTTTRHVRDCPGIVQVEITQGNVIWPVMKRFVFNPSIGAKEFTPDPWPVPEWAHAGPATYRVTTFWDCNWFQNLIPGWSIIQVGPDIHFEILPRKSATGKVE